ncbi:DNA-3-methyladenine glycosylase 2 [Biformimicrobium ophioploci]|uniref:DNA-3-methyladenine glycosylase II n=1 Tax=Biformimicrobium ophioploci TaxID=3036711 RepID=A0ABQ6LXW6_9GAMM|nr:DNA-3-methyladenine glycosylase 2 [Microbulbifer sp. NKW57]
MYARARLARDPRFDGSFYTAVRTTGIFCRPICPARPPKEENVTYYESAVEAIAAGYRPCLRCRPDAAPGSPAWRLVDTTLQRALGIMRSELGPHSIEHLSTRLGVSSRYLRKLFRERLGLNPLKIWQAERALFAFSLLRDTGLPVAQVAYEAGFNSIRRFNDVFREVYQQTPTEVRRGAAARQAAAPLALSLDYRPPFDWQRVLSFFRLRAMAGVEQVSDCSYRRSFCLDGQCGVVTVTDEPDKHRLRAEFELLPQGRGVRSSAVLFAVRQRLRRIFDLDANVTEIQRDLEHDPLLAAELASNPGIRLPGAWDPFEYALRAILGQQISVKAATTIAGRIVARCGNKFELTDGSVMHAFPSAGELADESFEGLGLTRKRAETLREFVRAANDGRVDFQQTNLEQWCAQMVELPGIGEWTAQYTAMRGLSMPDAFPASDLGILKALGGRHNGEWVKTTPARALARAEAWRPWRAYGALLCWQSLGSE